MAESSSGIARVGFFFSFVAFLAAAYYASTLRSEVIAERGKATAAAAQETSLQMKLTDAQKAAATSNDEVKSCQQQAADLKTKLDQATAAAAAAAQTRHKR